MNTLRNSIGLLLLSTTLMATTCKKMPSADALKSLSEGQWNLTKLDGENIIVPADGRSPFVRMEGTEGKLSGFGGCNQLFGEYKVEGENISFPMLGSTKMYCESTMKLEQAFTKALREASTYTLKGTTLTLFSAGKETATLVQQK